MEEVKQEMVEAGEHGKENTCRQSPVAGSLVEQILLSQPLNPLVKCEFEIMPRSAV